MLDAAQVQGDAVARARSRCLRAPEALDGPHPRRRGRPADGHAVADRRAGRPSSVPVTTVPAPLAAKTRSTQSRGRPRSAAERCGREQAVEGGAQLVEALRRGSGHLHDLGALQERPGDVVGEVEAGDRQLLGVDQCRPW